MDGLAAQLREKEYRLLEAERQLTTSRAEHTASLSAATGRLESEIAALQRRLEEQQREAEAGKAALKEEARRETVRQVSWEGLGRGRETPRADEAEG